MTDPESFDPLPGDLVVVPEGTKIPTGFPALVYHMKFLLTPSIIRTGSAMNLFQFKNSHLGKWFGKGQSTETLTVASAESGVLTALSPDFSDTVFEKMAEKDLDPLLMEKSHLEPRSDLSLVLQPVSPEVQLATFFRYARGMDVFRKPDGGESWAISPKGGVTFYVELDAANGCFAFAYSLCHSDENFCMKIGRHIAKQRFEYEDWYEVGNYDQGLSVVMNVKIAIHNLLYAGNSGKLAVDKTNVVFSSLSERFNEDDMKLIYKRI